MQHVLIDTDVILDLFFDRQPFSKHAARVFSMCEQQQLTGYITPMTYSNAYYLLRKTATHERVISKLQRLLSITELLVIDKNSTMQAMQSKFKDFEDALQNYAAENHSGMHVILTRNVKDYRHSRLSAMTPEGFIKGLARI